MKIPLTVATSSDEVAPADVIERLVDERFASRLADQDATLWGPEAESEAAVRLSWIGLPVSSRPLLAEIDALRAELWAEGVDQVALCGMGGSSLAPEVIARTYDVPLTVVDSTNPHAVRRAVSGDLSRTVVVVSSKSGGTLETDSQRRAFAAAFEAAGIDPASRFVAVTDEGSDLQKLGEQEGFRQVFVADSHVGGRYSALTAFGLVPTGLAGIDIAELLDEAEAVMDTLAADSPDNPALVLGAALGVGGGRDKVAVVDTGSGIHGFPDWAEQLVAESTGKLGTGILPVAVEDARAPEVRWPARDVLVAAVAPTATGAGQAAGQLGEPWISLSGTLGAQMLVWECATAVAGRLLGINPFDQPDVESAKKAARGLLDAQPEPDPAHLSENGIEVRGSAGLLDGVDTVAAGLQSLFSRLGDDGYVAVMAYVDSHRDAALHKARRIVAARTERPTSFGWGPRFLHSTGQYHKGGPAQGVFLQVTCEESEDLGIPGRPFTFQTLIAAQAGGDARVLAEHGRPVLRLHMTDPEAGVPLLLELLEQQR